jgi:hypothetical protein
MSARGAAMETRVPEIGRSVGEMRSQATEGSAQGVVTPTVVFEMSPRQAPAPTFLAAGCARAFVTPELQKRHARPRVLLPRIGEYVACGSIHA